MSGRILVLDLLFKILLASQIAGFFKAQYVVKESRSKDDFCTKININVLYNLMLSFWEDVVEHGQSR